MRDAHLDSGSKHPGNDLEEATQVSVAEILGSRMSGGWLFGASCRWTEFCASMTVKKDAVRRAI
jgi:hypothetical protein